MYSFPMSISFIFTKWGTTAQTPLTAELLKPKSRHFLVIMKHVPTCFTTGGGTKVQTPSHRHSHTHYFKHYFAFERRKVTLQCQNKWPRQAQCHTPWQAAVGGSLRVQCQPALQKISRTEKKRRRKQEIGGEENRTRRKKSKKRKITFSQLLGKNKPKNHEPTSKWIPSSTENLRNGAGRWYGKAFWKPFQLLACITNSRTSRLPNLTRCNLQRHLPYQW